MNKIRIQDLSEIAVGLNIEGCYPATRLPQICKWYNIIQVIDEPLKGETFEKVIKTKEENSYECIEEAVGIDINKLLKMFIDFIKSIADKTQGDILVHIHQLKGSTMIGEKLENMLRNTYTELMNRLKIIYDELDNCTDALFDGTSYNVKKIDYSKEYPTIKSMISLSQCAGFGVKPETWIIPNSFMDFDVKTNTIDKTNQMFCQNSAYDIMNELYIPYVKGNILVVNDLWNPDVNDPINNMINIC